MEKTMPHKHLDLEVDILPDEGDFEVVVSVGDVPVLQADVETGATTINALGIPVATITGDLTGLLEPLNLLEQKLESLKYNDLKNLEFNFDWDGPTDTTAELQLVIDKPGNQEDVILLDATLDASDSTINIDGFPEITLTGVNLAPLFPILEGLDLLV
jgi:hypothetical protein